MGDGTGGPYDTFDRSTPTLVSGGHTFKSVSTGESHTCGLTTAGAAYCWGANFSGQLGDGSTTNSATPLKVNGGLTFTTLSTGNRHSCGLTLSGSAYCWGEMIGSGTGSNVPVA
ncbi:MAG: hypothetical protein EBS94_16415, partial [Proteobacteria bacterium]|nr:hypothetical protein [Pseudomonadota bacterium]